MNRYWRMRDDVIRLQRQLHRLSPSDRDPVVKEARENLYRARLALERLAIERSR